MGGEGSMSHMINTLKMNRTLRRSKRRKFRNQKDFKVSKILKKWKYIEISEIELQKVKNRIKTKISKERRVYNGFAIGLGILFTLLIYHYRMYI